MDTSNGVSLSQFLEICKDTAKDLGIKYAEDALKQKIKSHFGIHEDDKWPTIFSDDCDRDVLAILQD